MSDSPAHTKRSRAFVFTWNNYPDDSWRDTLDRVSSSYWIVGKEVAPTTGTRHLQGYIRFGNARTVGSIRREMPGCHVSIARGTCEQNYDYCTKEGDYVESGVRPKSGVERGAGERARWDCALACARAGKLEDIPADIFIRFIELI